MTSEAVQSGVDVLAKYVQGIYNDLLIVGDFPRTWKRANNLVLVPKPSDTKRKYRSICFINFLAKLYESLIKNRLEEEVEDKAGLSPIQHGFKRHSTMTAVNELIDYARKGSCGNPRRFCIALMLDVRNVFNTAELGHGLAGVLARFHFICVRPCPATECFGPT